MGIKFHKSIKLPLGITLHISKTGMSLSKRIGPVTVNSKGKATINLGHGLRYEYKKKK